jgi:hypothetical protein
MSTREAIEREVTEAEDRLVTLETAARNGEKVTPADLQAARQSLDLARLRLDGVPELERRAAVAADHARADEVVTRRLPALRDRTTEHLDAIRDATEAVARIIRTGETLDDELAGTLADLRGIRNLPEGVALHRDRAGLVVAVEVGGRVWPVDRDRTTAALIEPLARTRHLLGQAGLAFQRLKTVWPLSGERTTSRGEKWYPTDRLRDALERAA